MGAGLDTDAPCVHVRRAIVNGQLTRWITVGPADQPGTSIVLSTPAVDPGLTDDERRTIVELVGHSDRDDAERDGERAWSWRGCDDHFAVRSRAGFWQRFVPYYSRRS